MTDAAFLDYDIADWGVDSLVLPLALEPGGRAMQVDLVKWFKLSSGHRHNSDNVSGKAGSHHLGAMSISIFATNIRIYVYTHIILLSDLRKYTYYLSSLICVFTYIIFTLYLRKYAYYKSAQFYIICVFTHLHMPEPLIIMICVHTHIII